jgi:hypothetical protein
MRRCRSPRICLLNIIEAHRCTCSIWGSRNLDDHCGVVEVIVEVAESFGMHCVNLVVMELHPFQEDSLRDWVHIALCHAGLNISFIWRHTWKRLKILRCHSIQIIYAQNLVENSDPRFSLYMHEEPLNRLLLPILLLWVDLRKLKVILRA